MGNSPYVIFPDKIQVSVSLSLTLSLLFNNAFCFSAASLPPPTLQLSLIRGYSIKTQSTYWFKPDAMGKVVLSDHWYSAKIPTTWISTVSFSPYVGAQCQHGLKPRLRLSWMASKTKRNPACWHHVTMDRPTGSSHSSILGLDFAYLP